METPKSSTDPRGFLAACPDLERFASDPAVAAAIAKGDGFALHAALRARHAGGRAAMEARALDGILALRRLFLRPVARAPSLHTLNGIGARMYGRSDAAPDGTYVGTHFLTALFVPVWPLAQYLVRSEGSRYQFFGEVPLSEALRRFRQVVLGLLVAAAAAVAFASWQSGRASTVHLLNGLDVPVTVEVAGLRIPLAERDGHVAIELPTGLQHARATTQDGRELERDDFVVPSSTDLVVYSVLGTAPLVVADVFYGPETSARRSNLRRDVYAGSSFVAQRTVDYVFKEAPARIETRREGEMRTRAYVLPGGWRAAVDALRIQGHSDAAALVARNVLRATPGARDALDRAVDNTYVARGLLAAIGVAEEAVAATPDDVDVHRMRQSLLIAAGRRDEVLRIYREAEERSPDSARAAYLRARVERGPESLRAFEAAARRFPDDPFVLRGLGWLHHTAGRHAEALRAWDRLERIQPAAAEPLLEQRAVSLVALGRGGEAVALVARSVDASDQLTGAFLYARVARLVPAPPQPPRHYLEALIASVGPGEAPFFRALAANVLGDPPPAPGELDAIEEPGARAVAHLLVDSVTNPSAAIAALAGADRLFSSHVDPTLRVLLSAEAARSSAELAGKIVGEVGEVPGMAELVPRFVAGEEPPDAAELSPEVRSALLLGRARALEAAGRDARTLYAEIRRREIVPGVVSVAMARWPRPAPAAHPSRPAPTP